MTPLRPLIRETHAWIWKHPFLLASPQLLLLVVEFLGEAWDIEHVDSFALRLAFVEVTLVLLFLIRAVTFQFMDAAVKGRQPGWADALAQMGDRAGALFLACFVTGTVVLVGVAAFVVPAIYFLTIYAFVPLCILDAKTPSLWEALSQSHLLARRFGKRLLFIVALMLPLMFAIDMVPWVPLQLAISLMVGTLFEVFFCVVYLKLRGAPDA